jgi:predicted 2-oxoglutarate/Fe(II)-dependent dioxygenase YbiX
MVNLFSEDVYGAKINPIDIEGMDANELARQQVLEAINRTPVTPSLNAYVPAEMENVQFARELPNKPYSSLRANQPSSIVGGMFSPEISRAQEMDYMLKRQAGMQNEAMAFAQLTPMQQAQFGFYRGGQQLGDALGGALGGTDPQLQRISFRNSIAQQIDMRDPESYFKAATVANQAGDREFANSLVEAGTKIESTMSQVDLRKANAQKARNYQQAQTDSAQRRASIAGLEEKLATDPTYKPTPKELANARFILANESKTRTQIDPVTGQLYIINGLDVNEAAPNLARYLKSEGTVAPESTTAPAPAPAATTQPSVAQPATVATTAQAQPQPVVIAKGVTAVPTEASKQKSEELAKKQKLEEEEKIRAVESFDDQVAAIQNLRDTIKTTKTLVSPYTTGYGSLLSVLPATDARTLEGNTQTIKNNVALSKLRELKQQSATGASGLGALNMKEFDAIQGIIAALDPKSKNYKNDLDKIDAFFERAENLLKTQSERAKKNVGSNVNQEEKVKALVDRAMADPRTRGTRAQVEATIRQRLNK